MNKIKTLLLTIIITALCGCNVLLYSDGERFNQKYYTNKDDSPIFKLVGTYQGNQFYELDEKYRNENEYGLLVKNQKVIKVVDAKSYPEIRDKLEIALPETTIARPNNSNNNQNLANQNNSQKPPDKPLTPEEQRQFKKIMNAYVEALITASGGGNQSKQRNTGGWCVQVRPVGNCQVGNVRNGYSAGHFQWDTRCTSNISSSSGSSGVGEIQCSNQNMVRNTNHYAAQCYRC
jgi:hypothetical protein